MRSQRAILRACAKNMAQSGGEDLREQLSLSEDARRKAESALRTSEFRCKSLQSQLNEAKSTIVDVDKTIRGMRSKFHAAFDLSFDKWNGTPDAANAAIGFVQIE